MTLLYNTRFSQVYSRKRNPVPKSVQVQASDSFHGNEVTISSPSLPIEPIYDIDLTIATRKETRECTKHSLHLLSHFLSFEKCLSSHKSFLMSLNIVSIPTTT